MKCCCRRVCITRSRVPQAWAPLAGAAMRGSGLEAHDVPALGRIFAASTVGFGGPQVGLDVLTYSGSSTAAGVAEWCERLRAALQHQAWREAPLERARTATLQQLDHIEKDLDNATARRFRMMTSGGAAELQPMSPAGVAAAPCPNCKRGCSRSWSVGHWK